MASNFESTTTNNKLAEDIAKEQKRNNRWYLTLSIILFTLMFLTAQFFKVETYFTIIIASIMVPFFGMAYLDVEPYDLHHGCSFKDHIAFDKGCLASSNDDSTISSNDDYSVLTPRGLNSLEAESKDQGASFKEEDEDDDTVESREPFTRLLSVYANGTEKHYFAINNFKSSDINTIIISNDESETKIDYTVLDTGSIDIAYESDTRSNTKSDSESKSESESEILEKCSDDTIKILLEPCNKRDVYKEIHDDAYSKTVNRRSKRQKEYIEKYLKENKDPSK